MAQRRESAGREPRQVDAELSQPNFIAEFSDWNFGAKPADAVFAFTPPAGATKIDFKEAGIVGGTAR